MMSLDLSSLSPAPWTVRPDRRSVPLDLAGPLFGVEAGDEDEAFKALARNAFDVMMQRGWYAVCDSEKWFVRGECCGQVQDAGQDGPWNNPFTALVEADKWAKEHGL